MLTHFDISPYPAIHSFFVYLFAFLPFLRLTMGKMTRAWIWCVSNRIVSNNSKEKNRQIHTEFLLSNWANLFDQSKQSHGFRCLCNLQIDKMCVLHWPIMWKTLKRFKSRVKLKRVFGASSEFPWYVCCVYFWFILFHSAFAHRCCVHTSNAYNDFDG